MNDERGQFRAAGTWDEVQAPRLEERAVPALIPWGLGDAEPAREDGLEDPEAYLCVACWEWHHDVDVGSCDAREGRAA